MSFIPIFRKLAFDQSSQFFFVCVCRGEGELFVFCDTRVWSQGLSFFGTQVLYYLTNVDRDSQAILWVLSMCKLILPHDRSREVGSTITSTRKEREC
jgi:hypothetical protein